MARREIITITDDLDGSDANETVRFGVDGKHYEIDLSDANADKLREALGPFTKVARIGAGGSVGRARR